MDYRKSRKLMWIGFLIGILIIALPVGNGVQNEKVVGGFMIAGAIVFFAALIQAFIFYRCPYCNYSLMNVRGEIPNCCPECGRELKE